jgi:bacteriocin-like protein
MENLTINELKEIKGGAFWDGVAVALYYAYKYSSVTAALVVGISEGYLENKT